MTTLVYLGIYGHDAKSHIRGRNANIKNTLLNGYRAGISNATKKDLEKKKVLKNRGYLFMDEAFVVMHVSMWLQ